MTEQDFQREGLEAYFNAHQFPDTDNDPSAIHHTLGSGPREAAPGNHSHTNLVFRAYRNAARNIGNGGWTTVHMDVVEWYSPSTFERIGAGDGGVRVKREGFYLLLNQSEWAANGTGSRGLRIDVNGTARNDRLENAVVGFKHNIQQMYMIQLNPGAEVHQQVWQNNTAPGGNLALEVGGPHITFLSMIYLGTTPLDFLLNEAWF